MCSTALYMAAEKAAALSYMPLQDGRHEVSILNKLFSQAQSIIALLKLIIFASMKVLKYHSSTLEII